MAAKDSLAGAARRRSEMVLAMQQLEHTAASPAGDANWLDDLVHAVRHLELAINHHISEVETPGGILDDIVDTAPRLQRAAEETREHHKLLTDTATAVLDDLASAKTEDPIPVSFIRASVLELLGELARHRQRGADLIYDAYDVDIGGY